MSGITIDFVTLAWALLLLVPLVHYATEGRSVIGLTMALSVGLYLIAQSGWTSSYLAGSEWGRVFSNYIWFVFNSSVLLSYTLALYKYGGKHDEE